MTPLVYILAQWLEMEGFPKGRPKVIKPDQLNMDTLKTFDYFFIKVKITEVGIRRKFPLLSVINKESGVRDWTNDLVGKDIYLSSVSLQDAITYQKIKFDIIEGYYYNEGFNNKINSVIRELFNKRLEAKKEKNPIQAIYKELMNSSYGKNGLKPIDDELKVVTKKDLDHELITNYNKINSVMNINGTYKYAVNSKKAINDHFNNIHCSVLILDWSKRIMNEVMTLAEDLGYDISYQDTDSMHIGKDNIDKLSIAYYDKFNRILIGKDMGQFHSDFEMVNHGISDNVYSKCLIALGKKCYFDELTTMKDGKEINDVHIRMKGIPNQSIYHYAETNNITIKDIYEKLYNGEEITFDLTCGNNKAIFEWNKNYYWSIKSEMYRKVKF